MQGTDAWVLVQKYFEIEDPTGVRDIGLELRLEAQVGSLALRGIIDRLELGPDGELIVTDYKTGRAPGLKYEQSKLGGVHFYSFLCQEVLGQRRGRAFEELADQRLAPEVVDDRGIAAGHVGEQRG